MGEITREWNSDKIIAAIKGESIWQDSTGNTRPPVDSPRETC